MGTVMDITIENCLGRCKISESAVTALAIQAGDQSGEDGLIVTGEKSGKVRIFNVPGKDENCSVLSMLEGHTGEIVNIAIGGVAKGSGFVCTASQDNTMKIWKREKGKQFLKEPQHSVEDYRPTECQSICIDGHNVVYVQAPQLSETDNS